MKRILVFLSLALLVMVSTSIFAATYYIQLWDDSHFQDRNIYIKFNYSNTQSIGNFNHIMASGKKGLNDKISSLKANIPSGWVCYLYEHDTYQGRKFPIRGQMSVTDLGFFGDRATSFRCEKDRGIQFD